MKEEQGGYKKYLSTRHWKQPTPTDINFNENLSFLERALFREVLALCQNEDRLIQFDHSDRHYTCELKRGQCILKVSRIAKDLKIGRKKVRKSLEIVSKWYSQMDIRAMPFGLIITVKDYDMIVKMDSRENNEGTIEGQWRNNRGTPNKSVKSVKSVESEKSDMYICSFQRFWDNYPKKVGKVKAEQLYKRKATSEKKEQAILKGLQRYLTKWRSEKTQKQYIPNPTTWLNGERWDDELEVRGSGSGVSLVNKL